MYKAIITFLSIFFICVLSLYVYNKDIKLKEDLSILKIQVEGLNKINTLYELNLLLKEYRGLLQSKDKPIEKLQVLQKRILYFLENNKNPILEKKILKLLNKNLEIKEEIFFQYTKIISLIDSEKIKIATNHKLFLELDKNHFNSIASMVYDLPKLVENIGKIRGLGTFILSENELKKSQTYSLKENMNNFKIYYEKMISSKLLTKNLFFRYEEFNINYKKLLNEDFSISESDYFLSGTFLIEELNHYYKKIEQKLLEDLVMKIEIVDKSIRDNIISFFGFIFIIFIISFYLYKKIGDIEKEKEKNHLEVKITNRLYSQLHKTEGVKGICDVCTKFLTDRYQAANAVLYLIDSKNKKFNLASTYNISEKHIAHIIDIDDGLISEAYKHKEIVIFKEDSRLKIDFGAFKAYLNKIVTIPIIYENEVISVVQLNFINNKSLDERLDKILRIFASNIYRYQKNEENKKYLELIDKYVITSSTNKDGIINYASEAFSKVSGYSKKELIGKSHNILRDEDSDKEFYSKLWNKIIKGQTWSGELVNKRKDGTKYWVKATISPEIGFYGDIIGFNSIRQDITDKKLIEEISIKDSLTTLYNRRFFDDIFPSKINIAKRDNKFLAFLILDIDFFKQYNDTYGHYKGDKVLKRVAKVMKNSFLRADDYCFRLGGEEFGILFFIKDIAHAVDLSSRLVKNIENQEIIHEKSLVSKYLTISGGLIVIEPKDNLEINQVYKSADILLYKAKENGRNKIEY